MVIKTASADLEKRLERYRIILIQLIHKRIPRCTIYLFGSRARKDYREGADIDIAIDAGAQIGLSLLGDLHVDLDETTIPVTVDFIDFNAVSDELRKRLLKEGIIWSKVS
jgi:uncharacterized protein